MPIRFGRGFRLTRPNLGISRSLPAVNTRSCKGRRLMTPTNAGDTKPTECPYRLVRSFPPGSAEPGHFLGHARQVRMGVTRTTRYHIERQFNTEPTECPHRLEHSFPPGSVEP